MPKEVYCIFDCDVWHTRDSMRLLSVCDKDNLDSMLATIKRDHEYTDNDMKDYIHVESVYMNCYA